MSKIIKFEDIEAWQKARTVNREIFKMTNNSKFSKDYALKDQIRRSAISIMSNIAEGFGRRGDRMFKNFLDIAHASSAELQSQLYLALDFEYISPKEFEDLYHKVDEVSKMIHGLRVYLLKSLSK